jgi:hypothetical protein
MASILHTNNRTETQLPCVALTTVLTTIVILIGILINYARLSDVKETLRAEMDKNHSGMLHRVGDLAPV